MSGPLLRIAFSGQVPLGREWRSGIAVQSLEVGNLDDDDGELFKTDILWGIVPMERDQRKRDKP